MKKLLPHFCIVMSLMFMTLLVVDQVNNAMGFINNQITKILMLIVFPIIIITMGCYISDSRKLARRRRRRESAERFETGDSTAATGNRERRERREE